jgi:hypothetical protein
MAVRFCCDWCDRQLPVEITGSGENKKITAELTYPKEVDLKEFFPHLCESCARKIDIVVRLSRESGYRKSDIMARYARINEERRRKLGTNG